MFSDSEIHTPLFVPVSVQRPEDGALRVRSMFGSKRGGFIQPDGSAGPCLSPSSWSFGLQRRFVALFVQPAANPTGCSLLPSVPHSGEDLDCSS